MQESHKSSVPFLQGAPVEEVLTQLIFAARTARETGEPVQRGDCLVHADGHVTNAGTVEVAASIEKRR